MKFSSIDDLSRAEHCYLGRDDVCYYLREYTPRAGFSHSATNDIVTNFKKPVNRRGKPLEWRHKEAAIQQVADELLSDMNPQWLRRATLVPMPPSASKGDSKYDDRMVQVLKAIAGRVSCDVRELLVQTGSTEPDHAVGEGGHRLTPDERERLLTVDEALSSPAPLKIGVVDDVLTNGSHFVAAKRVLQHRFPGVPVIGIFFARRKIVGPPP